MSGLYRRCLAISPHGCDFGCDFFYSYLKASMGESLLALRAGVTPKIIPTAEETPKDNRIEFKVTIAGNTLVFLVFFTLIFRVLSVFWMTNFQ